VATAPFGELLKRHRLSSGLSQETLAERARISVSAVGALERGQRRAPYRDTIALLAEALSLTVSERTELEEAAQRARGRQRRVPAAAQPPNNLPVRLTSFIARDNEVARLEALLEGYRLVTVTGPGGIGKTRLAIEVADRKLGEKFRHACFVDLSAVEDAAFVAASIASALEVPVPEGPDPFSTLAARLKARHLLLVLDNCEHVISSAALAVAAILRTCPEITILATSRERLAVTGERVFRLSPLALPLATPATDDEAWNCAAFRLLLERAASIEAPPLNAASLKIGAEICRQLEGIPLAIELAATRLPSLGFDALNERLKAHSLSTQGGRDLPKRHRTMLDTIAWSYDLLTDDERMVLRRVAVFRGPVTIDGAAAVCGPVAYLLGSLVDKSLLALAAAERPHRFVMMESVRDFATKKLHETGEFEASARAHAEWLATVADRAHERLARVSWADWTAEFGSELDDVRVALDRCLAGNRVDDALLAARILGGFRVLWIEAGLFQECQTWIGTILPRFDIAQQPVIAARLLRADVQTAMIPARFAASERAIDAFERIGDRQGLVHLYADLAYSYGTYGDSAAAQRAIDQAFALADQEQLQHSHSYIILLEHRSWIHILDRRADAARADLERAKSLRSVLDIESDPNTFVCEARLELIEGRMENVLECLKEFNTGGERDGLTRGRVHALELSATAHLVLGNLQPAVNALQEAAELEMMTRSDENCELFWIGAATAAVSAQPLKAAHLLGFAKSTCTSLDPFRYPEIDICHDITLNALRDQLAASALEHLVEEGSQLDTDGAFAELSQSSEVAAK
jgi:predicted ATPase/DNA-binding XRE family transcriptional regulator